MRHADRSLSQASAWRHRGKERQKHAQRHLVEAIVPGAVQRGAQDLRPRRMQLLLPRRLIEQRPARRALALAGHRDGVSELFRREGQLRVKAGQRLGLQHAERDGALGGRGALREVRARPPCERDQQTRAGVLEQGLREGTAYRVQHREVKRRCHRHLVHVASGKGIDQREERRIVRDALFAHQADPQHGLVDLAGQDLTEHQRLAPIRRAVALGDLAAHVPAGPGRIAAEQLALDPGAGDRFVVVTLGHDPQEIVQSLDVTQHRQAIHTHGQEVDRASLTAGRALPRRRCVGQQQAPGQRAHGSGGHRSRQPRQQPFDRRSLAAAPHIAAKSAALRIEDADRFRVDLGQRIDLDALNRPGWSFTRASADRCRPGLAGGGPAARGQESRWAQAHGLDHRRGQIAGLLRERRSRRSTRQAQDRHGAREPADPADASARSAHWE